MRKEVFYSLAALGLAPVAANAADGTVIPQVVTGDNWVGDIDNDNTNGEVRWIKDNVTFTVNKPLVPGKYTFTAKLTNPQAAVAFTINGVRTTIGKTNIKTPEQDVEIEFTLTETVEALQIKAEAISDFNEGDNNYFLLKFAKDGDGNLTQGIIFDNSNFKDGGKWLEPLKGINEAINTWVNKTLKYESDEAKRVMASEKEKIQKETTNDKLTYDFYTKNHLDDPTVETNPLYKEAAQKFNEATNIEAKWQADKIRKQVKQYLEDNGASLDDTENPEVKTPVVVMAKKVLDDVAEYESTADSKTKDANGNYLEAPVTINTEFDVDATVAPLKPIIDDANDLTVTGGKANNLVTSLQASYNAITDRDADLEDMYAPDAPSVGTKVSMANTHAEKAANYLKAAKKITAYYKDEVVKVQEKIAEKDIKDLTPEFVTEMKGYLADLNALVTDKSPYIKGYYELYTKYLAALEKAQNNAAKLNLNSERFANDETYKKMSEKFDELVRKQKERIELTPKMPEVPKKDGITLGITLKTVNFEKKVVEDAAENVMDKEILNGAISAEATPADANFISDFNNYVKGLNALDEAYAKFEAMDNAVTAKYKDYPNEDGYDNREYYREVLTAHDFTGKTNNGGWVRTDENLTTDPAKDFNADTNPWKFGAYLDLLKSKLDAKWGKFETKDGKEVYTGTHGDMGCYTKETNAYLAKDLADLTVKLDHKMSGDKYRGYQEAGEYLAPYYKDIKENLNDFEKKVETLREKVAGMPIYNAAYSIYAAAAATLKDENGDPFAYTHPADGTTGYTYTYKELITQYDERIKKVKDGIAEAMKKYDNTSTEDHINALWGVWNNTDKLNKGSIGDGILNNIDEFVRDGGIIDQQAKVYADKVPEDNFKQLMEYIGAEDGNGVLAKLWTRLKMDNRVDEPVSGWRDPLTESGDPAWKDGDYIVGIDKNGDGKLSFAEGVSIKALKADLKAYDGVTPLSNENVTYLEQLLSAYVVKYREAKAIFNKYNKAPYTDDPATLEKEKFEAANGELGVAIAIINELNQKLKDELEPALMEEAEAQYKWKQIVNTIKPVGTATDGESVKYQAGYVPTLTVNIAKWWNGRKGVSKKTMEGNVYAAFATHLDDDYTYSNPNDQKLFEEFKAIYKNAQDIFAAADEAYRTRNFDAWKLTITTDDTGGTVATIDNAELNQLEKDIKAFVLKCWKEQESMLEGVETLANLMTLSNIDEDDDDATYDWSNLIKAKASESAANAGLSETAVNLLKAELEKAINENSGLTAEQKAAKIEAVGLAVEAIRGAKIFAIEDLLATTGITAIKDNDAAAKSADDLLEPVADGKNLHTFENMLLPADKKLEPTDAPKAAEARMLAGAEEESIIAKLQAEANASSSVLYNKLQAFIEKVNAAIADRTLASKSSELKKELQTLIEDILNIDEHAAANKARFDEMNQKIADFEHGSSEMGTDNLQAIIDGMGDGKAKEVAQQTLDNFKTNYLDGLKAIVKHDYEQGWAWQDEFNSDTDTQGNEDKAFEEMQKESAKVYDILTGNNNTLLVDTNNETYAAFVDNYHDAQKEFADLVAKIEQFKNLNANVPTTGDFNKPDAEKLAEKINEFLFGKEENKDKDVIATLSAKDQLDWAYKEGTKTKEEANAKFTAWGDADYTKVVADVKQKIEAYIDEVESEVQDATEAWGDYSDDVLAKAQYALDNYQIYLPLRSEVNSKAPKAKDKYASEDAYKAAVAAYDAARKQAFEAIIAENTYWSDLYNRSTLMDAAIERYFDDNNLKTVGANTYRRNNFDNINALYDQVAYFKDNFGDELQNGRDAEAQADVAIYKAHGDAELAKDKAALEELGFELDQEFEGATETFQDLIDEYNALFTDADGEPIEITSANHDNIVTGIQSIFGKFKSATTKNGVTTYNWNEDGRCKFVHQLVTNASAENMALNEAILNDLQSKLDAAKAYIKDFQVGANYVEQIQVYQDLIDQAKENIKDEDYIKSAIVITNHVQGLVKEFGKFNSKYNIKKKEDYADSHWAGDDGIISSQDDIFGSMMAEDGYLPGLIDYAWDAEKKALENDVNEMRAELKKLSEQLEEQKKVNEQLEKEHKVNVQEAAKLAEQVAKQEATLKDYNDKIEALWKKVEAKKRETVTIVYKDSKDNVLGELFDKQTRDELLPLQNEIQTLYIELRGLTHASQNIAGIVGNANGRLAALRSNKVQDEYAAGAPDVQKDQALLNALIDDAQATLSATVANGSTDFFREKIEQMLQNAEDMLTKRDADAKVWTERKAEFDEEFAIIVLQVEKSKEAVNDWTRSQWIDGDFVISEEFPVEGYDLAATQSALYDIAAEKLQANIDGILEVVNNYELDGTEYDIENNDELQELNEEFLSALKEAENACADYDINARLSGLNKQLDILKNKAANGVYSDEYLDDKDIIEYKDGDDIIWGTTVTELDDAIAEILQGIEDLQYVSQLPGLTAVTYAELRAKIEKYIVITDPETGEDVLSLSDGAQTNIDALSDLLMNNVLGDMNNDGRVTLADARIISDIVLNYLPMPIVGSDEFIHADVNEDGKIDIADAACAVNIYFYGKPIGYWNPFVEARSAAKSNEKVEVSTSKTAEGLTRVAISLDNAQEYTAFQMDMLLPEGIKLAAATLGDRANSQFLMTNMVDDNVLRIAAMSITNKAISGNSGAVVYLDFEVAEGAQDEFARFSEVFFVNKQAQKTSFELGGITPTGIQSANAETALGQKIYDLGGRMKSSLKKGVNIIKDAAGNAKKVFTK